MKLWLPLILLVSYSSAFAAGQKPLGDEDPFPLACIHFTGDWISDDGLQYDIDQSGCAMITIQENTSDGVQLEQRTIVPDNVSRSVQGASWSGQARHRWDKSDYGSVLQSYITITHPDYVETDTVQLQIVGAHTLLETIRKTITPNNGSPRSQSDQHVFHRACTVAVGFH